MAIHVAREDDRFPDRGANAGFDDGERPEGIHLEELPRLSRVCIRGGQIRGGVNHGVDACKRFVERPGGGQVDGTRLVRLGRRREVPNERTHGVAMCTQTANEMAPDETGGTGNGDFHGSSSPAGTTVSVKCRKIVMG